MNSVWKFRFLAILIVTLVGGISMSNLAAEFVRATAQHFPAKDEQAPLPDQVSAAELASVIAPFRADLKADSASMLAAQALAGQSEMMPRAVNSVEGALNIGPHNSRMWLVLASLQAKSDAVDPRLAESLKMSYLTGPNRAELILTRLEAVTKGETANDPDLRELASSDVRAILTHFPDERQALVNDYKRASQAGRTFLEESVKAIDPNFVDALRSAK